MKKLIIPIIAIMVFTACSNKKPAEINITTQNGVIEGVTENTITINTTAERIEIENLSATTDDIGRDILIEYTNGELTNIEITGRPFETEAKKVLSSMSLEEKIGQLFLIRYPLSGAEEIVKNHHVGGFVMFARDFENESPESVIEKISVCQQASSFPLLIAVDEEGGSVVRVSKFSQFRENPFLSPSDLFDQGGFEAINKDTKEKSELLKSIGINVNLAPVADVSTNKNDYIHHRTLGLDAKDTAEYVETVISAMKKEKIGSVMKHFPGYGNNTDTHTGIAIDERDKETFLNNDLVPFISGIEAGADSILVSHNIVKCFDEEHPASLSPTIHDILRNVLGFDGVIMTDDLDMNAITQYTNNENSAVAAIKAGNDMVICSNYEEQINAVIEAVYNGNIEEETIDKATQKVIIWKLKLDII